MAELFDVVFRSVVVYIFIVVAIRLFGKREISQLSIIDLVFILLISNSVQNAMIGPSTSLQAGLVAAITLFLVNKVFGVVLFRSKKARTLVEGNPIMLVYHGKIIQKHLKQAEISREELDATIREHGVESEKDVDLAVLEADGNISVLSNNFKHKTVRKRKAHKVVEKLD